MKFNRWALRALDTVVVMAALVALVFLFVAFVAPNPAVGGTTATIVDNTDLLVINRVAPTLPEVQCDAIFEIAAVASSANIAAPHEQVAMNAKNYATVTVENTSVGFNRTKTSVTSVVACTTMKGAYDAIYEIAVATQQVAQNNQAPASTRRYDAILENVAAFAGFTVCSSG